MKLGTMVTQQLLRWVDVAIMCTIDLNKYGAQIVLNF